MNERSGEQPPEIGISFADGPAGTRAVIGGTGIDVWEVISTWKAGGGCISALRLNYPWLSDLQLRTALAYYHRHQQEIENRLERERHWTPDRIRRELPFLAPPHVSDPPDGNPGSP